MRTGLILLCFLLVVYASPGFAEEFTITTRTSNRRHADTDARVFIKLVSGDVTSDKIFLDGGEFAQGDTDVFNIEAENIHSPVSSIQLGHDNTGPGPSWHVNDVTVHSPTTGITQTFPIHGWVSGNSAGGKTIQEDVGARKEDNTGNGGGGGTTCNSTVKIDTCDQCTTRFETVEQQLKSFFSQVEEKLNSLSSQVEDMQTFLSRDIDGKLNSLSTQVEEKLNSLNSTVEEEKTCLSEKEYARLTALALGFVVSNENNGSRYYLPVEDVAKSDQEAIGQCKNVGGHLAEIDSQPEQDFVASFLDAQSGIKYVYFSGTDAAVEGTWVNQRTGEKWGFSNWMDGYPKKGTSGNCIFMAWKRRWADWRCSNWDSGDRFLCEVPV